MSEDDKDKREGTSSKSALAIIAILFLLLLPLYVLAPGPIVWLGEIGYIDKQYLGVVLLPFSPLEYLYEHVPFVRGFYDWYFQIFR